MELKITQKDEKPLLKRSELVGTIVFEGTTPSRFEVAKAIAAKEGCSQELVVVKSIKTSFGETKASVECNCYTDANVMKELERENLLQKHKEPEVEAPAEEAAAPAEEAAEAPAEEASEAPAEEAAEAPAEEKKEAE